MGDNHHHDHHDHEHHHEPAPAKSRGPLTRAFSAANAFTRTPRGVLVTTALLATTALVTPLLGTTIGAGLLMMGGLAMLSRSSDVMLDATEQLGGRFHINPMMLGVGLGALHSLPELMVAASSVWAGAESIAMGNLIGANVAHVFLILGAAAAVGGGIAAGKGLSWKYNMTAMAGATLGYGALLATNGFNTLTGLMMLGLGAAYVGGNVLVARRDAKTLGLKPEDLIHTHDHGDHEHCAHDHDHDHHHHDEPAPKQSILKTALLGGAGFAALAYTAHLSVDAAVRFAGGIGFSEAVIGTLAVALGTSLPELTTSVRAAQRGNTTLAVGNVLGCNIFNILFIGGALAMANTAVPAAFGPSSGLGAFNLAALGVSAGLMTTTLMANKGGIKRWQGYAAMGLYGAWCAVNVALGGQDSLHAAPQEKQPIQTLVAPAPHTLPKSAL
jgi:cation:H+ antiporter